MALCITRKEGQSVMIGDGIEVTVHALGRTQVKLLIKAPKEVRVLRSEILQREDILKGDCHE